MKVINSLQEMKLFVGKNKFSQKIFLSMADIMMTSADRRALAESFQKFDLNHDGLIDIDEFTMAIQYAGLSYKEDQAREIFTHLDQNKNGSVEYTEFLAVFVKIRRKDFGVKLRMLFNEIDVDNDGFISMRENRDFFGDQPGMVDELEKFAIDSGTDEKLSYDQFKEFFFKNFMHE